MFISGVFGKLSMGDVDGAAQMETGHIDQLSLTDLNDIAESTFIGAGGFNGVTQAIPRAGTSAADPLETRDPTLLYEYAIGDFIGYFSVTNPVDVLVNTTPNAAAATNVLSSNAMAYAVGVKYTFGDYYAGLGYEKLSGWIAPGAAGIAPGVAVPADNTDLKHVVVTVGGTVAGFTFKGLYGKASGTIAGANIVRPGLNGKQYAMSVSYSMDAITGTAFYTDDSALGGTAVYCLGAAYDLGGGAQLVGGIAKAKRIGNDPTAFDLGVKLAF